MESFNKSYDSSIALAGLDELVSMDDTEREAEEVLVPLRQWTETEQRAQDKNHASDIELRNESLLRKVTLAYAICKSVQHISHSVSLTSDEMLDSVCAVDNFVVRVSEDKSDPGWRVKGVETVSPTLVLKLKTDDVFDGDFFNEDVDDVMGKNLSPSITIHSSRGWRLKAVPSVDHRFEKRMCHLLGCLLRFIFTGRNPNNSQAITETNDGEGEEDDITKEPPHKKKSIQASSFSDALSITQTAPHHEHEDSESARSESLVTNSKQPHEGVALKESLCPSTVIQVIQYLIDADSDMFASDNAYQSADAVIHDLHLILKQPKCFLFENYEELSALSFNKGKLYGRSKEINAIKNVFSQVYTSGRSEACFISGYSG